MGIPAELRVNVVWRALDCLRGARRCSLLLRGLVRLDSPTAPTTERFSIEECVSGVPASHWQIHGESDCERRQKGSS